MDPPRTAKVTLVSSRDFTDSISMRRLISAMAVVSGVSMTKLCHAPKIFCDKVSPLIYISSTLHFSDAYTYLARMYGIVLDRIIILLERIMVP